MEPLATAAREPTTNGSDEEWGRVLREFGAQRTKSAPCIQQLVGMVSAA
jgi:hypothetical protein